MEDRIFFLVYVGYFFSIYFLDEDVACLGPGTWLFNQWNHRVQPSNFVSFRSMPGRQPQGYRRTYRLVHRQGLYSNSKFNIKSSSNSHVSLNAIRGKVDAIFDNDPSV
ncbi:hypothetical protein ABW21_db0204347 [Orbilia brochopaga]|nr:hypothetical protein ABW21_db0204347 [Drechslerella brochopaga]